MVIIGSIGPLIIRFATADTSISTGISGSSYADECACGLTGLAAKKPAEDAMIALPFRDD
jgi:hypothetical protein